MIHIFIINPIAGVKNQVPIIKEEITKCFDKHKDLTYLIYETKREGDATVFVSEYVNTHIDDQIRFYACGGDGTLNEVVNGSFGFTNVEVACVPIGSGNDFIKFFGTSEEFRNIENLLNGKAIDCDLIKMNDRYVVNIFNVGVDATAALFQKKLKKFPLITGTGAYRLGVLLAFLGKITNYFKVTADDEVIYSGKALLCAVCNAKCYGGGYYCAPNADVNDNLIDVCLVKKVSKFKFLRLIKIYKNGKHLEHPKVIPHIIYKQCQRVQIELGNVCSYSIDGEVGKIKKTILEVINNGFKFVIPKKI